MLFSEPNLTYQWGSSACTWEHLHWKCSRIPFHAVEYCTYKIIVTSDDLPGSNVLTHWGWDKMDAISQTTFSSAFSCMKILNVWIPIWISLKFVPKGPINNIPALVQIMAWRRPGNKPLSEPMMVRLPMHICITRPQWVNERSISDPNPWCWKKLSPLTCQPCLSQMAKYPPPLHVMIPPHASKPRASTAALAK